MTKDNVTLNNGQQMPMFGLGTLHGNGQNDEIIRQAICSALECGYRYIDTAYAYMNEEIIGNELQHWFSNRKLKRQDIFVSSKLPVNGNRRSDVSHFLRKSLEKLKLDYVDLYLIHLPFGVKLVDDNVMDPKDSDGKLLLDFDTDLEELWKGMEEQVDAGRTKAIGISNFNGSQIERIMKIARIPPVVSQMEVHGYHQQRTLVEKCKEFGIAVVGYAPLGAPFIKGGKAMSPPLLGHPKVMKIGNHHGKSSAQVLLKFLHQRDIIVIPKSVSPERIESNRDISDFHLSEDEMKSMASLDKGGEGRLYHFNELFSGCQNHQEYPFHSSSGKNMQKILIC